VFVLLVMTNVLLFAASAASDFSFHGSPDLATRETIPRMMRSGAAKKQKRVRRTEGRTGLLRDGAREGEDGEAVPSLRDMRAVRHGTCRRSAREKSRYSPGPGPKIPFFPAFTRFYADFTLWRNSDRGAGAENFPQAHGPYLQHKQ
jgi:hypothetical protein